MHCMEDLASVTKLILAVSAPHTGCKMVFLKVKLACISCESLCNLVLPEPLFPEAQQQAQEAADDPEEQHEEAAESVQPAKPAAGGGRGRGKGKGEGKGEGKGGAARAKGKEVPDPVPKPAAGQQQGVVQAYSQETIQAFLGPKGRHKVHLDQCFFDCNREYGQPRVLKAALWSKYYNEMLNSHPPRVPYAEGLAWQKAGVI